MRLFVHRTANQAAEARRGYNVMGDIHVSIGEGGGMAAGYECITIQLCDGIKTGDALEYARLNIHRLKPNGRLVFQV